MAHLKSYLLVAAVTLVLSWLINPAHVSQAVTNALQTVWVVNPRTNPVPVAGAVAVSNTLNSPIPVAVRGTASVQGSVSISGTAKLGIDPTANTVQVASSPQSPIYVATTDPAQSAFQASVPISGSCLGVTGTVPVTGTLTPPGGTRLVIENIGYTRVGPQPLIALTDIQTTVNGATAAYPLNTIAPGESAPYALHLYADGGTPVTFPGFGNCPGATSDNVNFGYLGVSGYLVTVP